MVVFKLRIILSGEFMSNEKKINPFNIQIKDEIKNIINKRKEVYKSAHVLTSFFKINDSWEHVFTTITLSDKDEDISEVYTYKDFIIKKITANINDFLMFLDDLVTKSVFEIKDCPKLILEGNFDTTSYWHYIPSDNDFLKNVWPSNNYVFNVKNDSRNYPRGPFISSQCPFFPSMEILYKYFAGFDVTKIGDISIFLPNYKIKINKMTLSSEHLNLEIINNGIPEDEIIGKLYYEKEEQIRTRDFFLDKNPINLSIDFIPDIIEIYLLKNDGEILDSRRNYLKWPVSNSDKLNVELKEKDILSMIKQGEDENIEFKQELNNKGAELAETIVSFANGKGGSILLGVNDRATIVGFKQDKLEESIINNITSLCQPFIKPDIKEITIDKTPIAIIRINEGDNKPYTLRDRGVIVRRGSTDRVANRMELDEFYENKTNQQYQRFNSI